MTPLPPPTTNVSRSPAEAALFDQIRAINAARAAAKAAGDLETAANLCAGIGSLSRRILDMRARGEAT